MRKYKYELLPDNDKIQLGLIVLQSDVTLEDEFRQYFHDTPVSILANRIPFENEVTIETLRQMESHLTKTTSLFPLTSKFDAIGYGCTSGALHIGSDQIEKLVQAERECAYVSNPMRAAINRLKSENAQRIAYLGPYSQAVCQTMIDHFEEHDIHVPIAASFDEDQDKFVGRISPESIFQTAVTMLEGKSGDVDAIFISCTNMKCISILDKISRDTGVLALSSNYVLAWDLARQAGVSLNHTRGCNDK